MKALILDDEFMHAEYLRELINRHVPEIKEVQVYTQALEALKWINQQVVDLLFLDIEMPGLDGFDLIEIIPKDRRPAVIFTSAHAEYAIKAFELPAIHYLLKPIAPNKLQEAVRRISTTTTVAHPSALSPEISTITLPEGQHYHIVKLEQIVRIEGAGSYATFYLNNQQRITVSKRLKIFANQLGSKGFIRTHQSHLVNERYIKLYSRSDGSFLVLEDGSQVPVSAKIKPELKKRLKL